MYGDSPGGFDQETATHPLSFLSGNKLWSSCRRVRSKLLPTSCVVVFILTRNHAANTGPGPDQHHVSSTLDGRTNHRRGVRGNKPSTYHP